tara:strand:- start:2126 stop:2908 length:783 start_codon:yes stop_codon:yes gene_type:complete
MAHMGYEHSLSLGDLNSGVLRANQEILLNNKNKLSKYQDSINKSNTVDLTQSQNALTTLAGEQFATKGKAVKRTIAGAKQVGKAVEQVSTALTSKIPVSKAVQLETKGGNLVGHARDLTSVDLNLEKVGLGDVAGAGLQALSGGIDLAGDIKAGKITGDNWLERAGNVLDIGAGALETAGVTADLTGVLAPEGLVANAIGGVVGLAGGVLDLAGDLEDAFAPHNPGNAPKTVAPLSVLATGSTGAEVKSNIQNSGVKLGT